MADLEVVGQEGSGPSRHGILVIALPGGLALLALIAAAAGHFGLAGMLLLLGLPAVFLPRMLRNALSGPERSGPGWSARALPGGLELIEWDGVRAIAIPSVGRAEVPWLIPEGGLERVAAIQARDPVDWLIEVVSSEPQLRGPCIALLGSYLDPQSPARTPLWTRWVQSVRGPTRLQAAKLLGFTDWALIVEDEQEEAAIRATAFESWHEASPTLARAAFLQALGAAPELAGAVAERFLDRPAQLIGGGEVHAPPSTAALVALLLSRESSLGAEREARILTELERAEGPWSVPWLERAAQLERPALREAAERALRRVQEGGAGQLSLATEGGALSAPEE